MRPTHIATAAHRHSDVDYEALSFGHELSVELLTGTEVLLRVEHAKDPRGTSASRLLQCPGSTQWSDRGHCDAAPANSNPTCGEA